MFNIRGKRERALYQRQLIKIFIQLERLYANEIRRSLNVQFLQAARAIESGDDNVDFIIENSYQRLVLQLANHYKRVGNIFSRKTFDEVEKLKDAQGEFWQNFNTFIKTQAANKIRKVTDTTKRIIAKIIGKSIESGLSRKEIAKEIRQKAGILNPARAATIARTETHTGSMKATEESVKSTRIQVKKEWVATFDDRTRIDHLHADGQEEEMDGFFIVGGESLKYPGDPSGSAGNTINCRCVMIFNTV